MHSGRRRSLPALSQAVSWAVAMRSLPRPRRARRLTSSTAAGSVTASRPKAAPAPSSPRIPLRLRRSRLSCAPPTAPCRPTRRRSCRTTISRISTPICKRSRSRRITRAFPCSTSSGETETISVKATASQSQIEHQPLALAAGATDHDFGVRGLLLLGQDGVAVLGDARNHPLLAGTADAELAGIVDVHAGIEQHLQDALAFGNDEFLSRARELDHEAALLVRLLLGGEIFDVDLRARPIRGRGLERFEHRRRSAAIEVRVLRRLGDDRLDVEDIACALVVEMELRRAHGFERLQKGHVGARAAGVIELPRAAELV